MCVFVVCRCLGRRYYDVFEVNKIWDLIFNEVFFVEWLFFLYLEEYKFVLIWGIWGNFYIREVIK